MKRGWRRGTRRWIVRAPVVAQVVVAAIDDSGAPASMATVFSSQASTAFQFPVLAQQARLGFAIANDTDVDATCRLVLQDPQRVNLEAVTLPVPAKSNWVQLLSDSISIPESFLGGSAAVSCDQQVAMIGLHFELRPDGSIITFNTLPPAVVDPSPGLSEETAKRFHVLPHIADGGGWQSSLLVTNVSQSASSCTLQLYGLGLDRFEDARGVTAAGFDGDLRATGSGAVTWYGAPGTNRRWHPVTRLSIVSTPSWPKSCSHGSALEGRGPAGMATVFRSQTTELVQLPVLTATGTVGFAIANDTSSEAACRIEVEDAERLSLGAAAITVPAKTNTSRMLHEAVSLPEGFHGGTARIGCDQEVAVIGLHFELEPDGAIITFSTLLPAVIDAIQPTVELSRVAGNRSIGARRRS